MDNDPFRHPVLLRFFHHACLEKEVKVAHPTVTGISIQSEINNERQVKMPSYHRSITDQCQHWWHPIRAHRWRHHMTKSTLTLCPEDTCTRWVWRLVVPHSPAVTAYVPGSTNTCTSSALSNYISTKCTHTHNHVYPFQPRVFIPCLMAHHLATLSDPETRTSLLSQRSNCLRMANEVLV